MKIPLILTPKNIILSAIRNMTKNENVKKLVLQFFIDTEKYNIFLQCEEGNIKFDATIDELTILKKVFISRIVTKWNERYNDKPKVVIIEVDLFENKFNIFIQNYSDEILKFDY
jgi:hypothetical protein